jgi:signal peptidase I
MSAASKLRRILKNEWVRTGIMLAIVLIAFFSFWFGVRAALATEYPLLSVATGSMEPTLNVGDLIIVHGVSNFSEIYAHLGNGDIIVFHTYIPDGPELMGKASDELIVHRAINMTQSDGHWYFDTAGDHNLAVSSLAFDPWDMPPYANGKGVPDYYIVGKVVGTVPYVGGIPLFIRTPEGIATVVVLIILALCIEFVYSAYKEKRKPPAEVQP